MRIVFFVFDGITPLEETVAALVGLAKPSAKQKRSALAVEQQRLARRGAAISGLH